MESCEEQRLIFYYLSVIFKNDYIPRCLSSRWLSSEKNGNESHHMNAT